MQSQPYLKIRFLLTNNIMRQVDRWQPHPWIQKNFALIPLMYLWYKLTDSSLSPAQWNFWNFWQPTLKIKLQCYLHQIFTRPLTFPALFAIIFKMMLTDDSLSPILIIIKNFYFQRFRETQYLFSWCGTTQMQTQPLIFRNGSFKIILFSTSWQMTAPALTRNWL